MANRPKSIFDYTLLITFVPAYVYVCTFLYESGMCQRWGIPDYLIEPSLNTLLIFGSTITVALLAIGGIFAVTLLFLDAFKLRIHRVLVSLGLFNITTWTMFWLVDVHLWSLSTWLSALIISAGLSVLSIILLALSNYRSEKLAKKGSNDAPEDYNNNQTSFGESLFSKMKIQFVLAILAIVMLPLFSKLWGLKIASIKRSFLTVLRYPDYVVLKKYGETVICKKVNLKTKGLSDTLLLIKESDSANNSFILQPQFGPLKLKDYKK